jgi:glutamate--cysteine ligase
MQEQQPPASEKASPAPAEAPIGATSELIAHFQRGCKHPDALRIGLEHEKMGMALMADGSVRPLPYAAGENEPQIRSLLSGLQSFGWQPVLEEGSVIALKRGSASVTLEPGGQFELSGPPLKDEIEAADDLDAHLAELLPIAEKNGIAFIGTGFRPLGTWNEVSWVPKGRYVVMREFLPTRGKLGVEMMKRTTTVQANLDFVSEADAVLKMRVGLGLGPLVTAVYAASPLVDGKPNGYKSFRAACWLDTDNDRCGILPFMFRDGAGFADYAEWALDVPMFFVYRHKHYTPAGGITFRNFLRDGFRGERATLADWELHLSTLFPEARLKQYIELRSADAGPLPYIRALAALWRGLFYSQDALHEAWKLVADLTLDEREMLRRSVPQGGLQTVLRGRPIAQLCEEMLRIASDGLVQLESPKGVALLAPLREAVKAGRCPADDILDAFVASNGDPRAFVEKTRLRD